MTLEKFKEKFRSITDEDLISILRNKNDFNPLAIEAAEQELANRNLTIEEVQNIESFLTKKAKTVEQRKEKANAAVNTFFETLNPIQKSTPQEEKVIRYISLVFSFILLYSLVSQYKYLYFIAKDFKNYPYYTIIGLLPLVLMLVAIITFWRKKTIGWLLFVLLLCLSISNTTFHLIQSISPHNDSPLLEKIFPRSSFLPYLLTLIFYGSTLYLILREKLRTIFNVGKSQAILATVISVFISLLFLLF